MRAMHAIKNIDEAKLSLLAMCLVIALALTGTALVVAGTIGLAYAEDVTVAEATVDPNSGRAIKAAGIPSFMGVAKEGFEQIQAKAQEARAAREAEEARIAWEEAHPWRTGIASAYGGSTDPGCGSTTATGGRVTESSMGVAVPMSWPNYRSYFGRTVEISYGGRTVQAVVNDCGGMGGGSRALDLQPGVFRALGANSCDGWGLRTVSYRFL